jgi:hypothetical protein
MKTTRRSLSAAEKGTIVHQGFEFYFKTRKNASSSYSDCSSRFSFDFFNAHAEIDKSFETLFILQRTWTVILKSLRLLKAKKFQWVASEQKVYHDTTGKEMFIDILCEYDTDFTKAVVIDIKTEWNSYFAEKKVIWIKEEWTTKNNEYQRALLKWNRNYVQVESAVLWINLAEFYNMPLCYLYQPVESPLLAKEFFCETKCTKNMIKVILSSNSEKTPLMI